MEEHIFYKEDEILISSTRIALPNLVIAVHSVSSLRIDKEEVRFPWIMFAISFFSFLVWIFNPTSEMGQMSLFIGIFLLLISLITWIIQISRRKEALLISLTSGETEYIDKEEVDNLQNVFKAISNAIVFRG
jgi:hypothetical protein